MPATITGECEERADWSGKSMETLTEAFSCAICCEVFTDPVKWPCGADAQCTHAFCRLCAFHALQSDVTAGSCPMCRAPTAAGANYSPASALQPDTELRECIADVFATRADELATRAEAHALAITQYEEKNVSETMLHLVRRRRLNNGRTSSAPPAP